MILLSLGALHSTQNTNQDNPRFPRYVCSGTLRIQFPHDLPVCPHTGPKYFILSYHDPKFYSTLKSHQDCESPTFQDNDVTVPSENSIPLPSHLLPHYFFSEVFLYLFLYFFFLSTPTPSPHPLHYHCPAPWYSCCG